MQYFKAGCLSSHISALVEITSEEKAILTVQGMKQEFKESSIKRGCSRFEIPKKPAFDSRGGNKLL